MHADDLTMYLASKNLSNIETKLQTNIDSVEDWCKNNKYGTLSN